MSATAPMIEDLGPEALERLKQLLQRAERGDEAALPALGLALDAHPEIWQRYGDLGKQAEAAWVELVCGPNLLLRESVLMHFRAPCHRRDRASYASSQSGTLAAVAAEVHHGKYPDRPPPPRPAR